MTPARVLLCGFNLAIFTAQCAIPHLAILTAHEPTFFCSHRFSFMQ